MKKTSFFIFIRIFLVGYSLVASGFLHAQSSSIDPDPLESLNRRVFQLNESLDSHLIRPVAQVYSRITPNIIEKGIGHFFNNLGETITFVNEAFQGKWTPAVQTGGRFLINSTVGLFGFVDVASHFGLPQYDEDFGQTLGYWGVPSGPYLVIPVIGPSSLRDATGLLPKYFLTDPTAQLNMESRYGLYTVNVVQSRAKLLSVDNVDATDKYAFIRGVYLQRREFFIKDGKVQDEFIEE